VDLKNPVISGANVAADHLKGLKIAWLQNQLLELRYDEARISQFKNIWQSKEVRDFKYVVELRLQPTGSDFSLPFGDRNW
jgi:hypothetical protein